MKRNLSGGEHCAYCYDEAQVLVGYSAMGTDEMAPCPHCERGHRLEHSTVQLEHGRDGKTHEAPRRVPEPWKHGYWQGRPAEGVEPEPDPAAQSLSRAENARRWAELQERMKTAVKSL